MISVLRDDNGLPLPGMDEEGPYTPEYERCERGHRLDALGRCPCLCATPGCRNERIADCECCDACIAEDEAKAELAWMFNSLTGFGEDKNVQLMYD